MQGSRPTEASPRLLAVEVEAMVRDLDLHRSYLRNLETLYAQKSGALSQREELLVEWAAEIERLRAETAELTAAAARAADETAAITAERDELRAALHAIRSHPVIRAAATVRRQLRRASSTRRR
jgi:chromosome segregation ATPase